MKERTRRTGPAGNGHPEPAAGPPASELVDLLQGDVDLDDLFGCSADERDDALPETAASEADKELLLRKLRALHGARWGERGADLLLH